MVVLVVDPEDVVEVVEVVVKVVEVVIPEIDVASEIRNIRFGILF